MNNFVIICLSFVLASCSFSNGKIEYTPPTFESLEQVSIENIGPIFQDLTARIYFIDNYVVMNYKHINGKVFHVHSLKDNSYITSFGDIGHSNYEFGRYGESGVIIKDHLFRATVRNRPYILEFDLSYLIKGKDTIPVTSIPKNYLRKSFRYTAGPNETFLGFCGLNDRVALYDKEFNIIDSSDNYAPLVFKDKPPIISNELKQNYMNRTGFRVSPNGQNFFFQVQMSGAVYELFEVKENRIIPITTKYFYPPTVETTGEIPYVKDPDVEAWDSYCTDENIYFTYRKKDEEMNQYLKVMDWQGNPSKEYDLGVHMIRLYMNNDDKTGYIIYMLDDDQFQLAKFEL